MNKKIHSFKFHDSDWLKWKKRAKKLRLPLTTLIEKSMNRKHDDNDKHLFI